MTLLVTQDYILWNDSVILPCDLRGRSAATRLLGLRVWISQGAWMTVSRECFVLSESRGVVPCVCMCM
jgi:hypothetical protein